MAEHQLQQLMKNTDLQYAAGSPLLLDACALYLDKSTGNCVAQLKWKNLDQRPVRAALIELDCFDAFDQKTEPVHYQYDGFLAPQGSNFGSKTPVIISNSKVVKYNVILKAVSFSDQTIWRPETAAALKPLPESKPQLLKGKLLEQFQRDLTERGIRAAADYTPQEAMGLWQCGCASWQYQGSPCLKCRLTQADLSRFSDETVLSKHLNAYNEEQERIRLERERQTEEARLAKLKEEEDKRRQEEEERLRQEELEREEEERAAAKRKKTGKILTILLIIELLLLGIGCTVYFYIMPLMKYNNAVKQMEAGRYQEAQNAFDNLGTFSDSEARLRQTMANYYFSLGQYDAVGNIYASLDPKYQDHANDFVTMYNDAVKQMDEGQYDEAVAAFIRLGNYSNSKDMINRATYRKACTLAKAGQYDDAVAIFNGLNGYEDSANLSAKAQADKQYDAGYYAGAWDIYSTLGEQYQTHNTDYSAMYDAAKALMDGGSYDEATDAFELLGGYSDSYRQAVQSQYLKAGSLAASGNYDDAIALYNILGNYSNSVALATKASADKLYDAGNIAEAYDIYTTLDETNQTHAADYAAMYDAAVALRENGSYDEAEAAFTSLGDYSDSRVQIVECRYQKAGSLAASGNYDDAIELYNSLAVYGDSKNLAAKTSADKLYDSGSIAEAYDIYTTLDETKQTHAADYAAMYDAAKALLDSGDFDGAEAAFTSLGRYSDSSAQIPECRYRKAAYLAAGGNYDDAIALYNALADYGDSKNLTNKASADKLYDAGSIAEAYDIYTTLDEAYQTHAADYAVAYETAENARLAGDYDQAYDQFVTLGKYSDAADKAVQCGRDKADSLFTAGNYTEAANVYAFIKDTEKSNLSLYQNAAKLADAGHYTEAAEQYTAILNYKDSREQRYQTALKAVEAGKLADAYAILVSDMDYRNAKENIYQIGVSASAAEQYELSVQAFAAVGVYKDAAMNLTMDTYAYGEQLHNAGRYDEAAAVFAGMNGFSNTAEKAQISAYAAADEALANDNYEDAVNRFKALGDYSDSAVKVKEAMFRWADSFYAAGNYETAATMFESLGNYSVSATRLKSCQYAIAQNHYDAGNYEAAVSGFRELSGFNDAGEKELASRYALYGTFYDAGQYDKAIAGFEELTTENYSDSGTRAKMSHYAKAQSLDARKHKAAYEEYTLAGDYSDAAQQAKIVAYEIAQSMQEENNYPEAVTWYEIAADYSDAKEQLYKIGSFYFSTEEYDLSVYSLKTLAGYKDASDSLHRIGNYFVMQSDMKKAYLAYGYESPLGEENQNAADLKAALKKLAEDHITAGEFDEAVDIYITLSKIDPGEMPTLNSLYFKSLFQNLSALQIENTRWKYLGYEENKFIFVSQDCLADLCYSPPYYGSKVTTVNKWIESAPKQYFSSAELPYVRMWLMSQDELVRYMPTEADRICSGTNKTYIWTSTIHSTYSGNYYEVYSAKDGSIYKPYSYSYGNNTSQYGVRPGMELAANDDVYELIRNNPDRYIFCEKSGAEVKFEPLAAEDGQRLPYGFELPRLGYQYTVSGTNASYSFLLAGNGYYVSENKGKNSSCALCKITFTTNTGYIYLDCINYAESYSDYGIVSKPDRALSTKNKEDSAELVFKAFSKKSDNKSGVQTLKIPVDDAEHVLYVKYIKDSYGNSNNDSFQFKVRFE